MSFLKLILKNVFRSKLKNSLTIIGIMLSVIVIISFGSLGTGAKDIIDESQLGTYDLDVMKNISDEEGTDETKLLNESLLNEDYIDKMKNISGVTRVVGLYSSYIVNNSDEVGIDAVGIKLDDMEMMGITITNGSSFSSDNATKEIIVNPKVSKDYNVSLGDNFNLGGYEWKIVGIGGSGNEKQRLLLPEIYIPLKEIQNVSGEEINATDKINHMAIKLDKNSNKTVVGKQIEKDYPELDVLGINDDYDMTESDNLYKYLNDIVNTVTVIGVLLGAFVVIVSMLKSVHDRTREIGVLKAVGWKKRRIIIMILGETILLTIIGTLLGFLVAMYVIPFILNYIGLETVNDLVYGPGLTNNLFITSAGLSLLMALLGGFYPALRASRLAPTEALRYE